KITSLQSSLTEVAMQKKRVCIIGGGSTGLCCCRVLLEYNNCFEPVIFERQSFIGGQWHYQDVLSIDNNKQDLTSSVYPNMLTNIPCSLMQYSDFPFLSNRSDSYFNVHDMEKYLLQYVQQHQLQKYLLLNVKIDHVQELSIDTGFNVTYTITTKHNEITTIKQQSLLTNLSCNIDKAKRIVLNETEDYCQYIEHFDVVCVCNGHFSKYYIPDINGLIVVH
ncbi:unnamed protein product, partial [Didymodactylos carnosus]